MDVHAVPREPRVRVRLRSGRCLDVDRAVLVIGSVAAAGVEREVVARPPTGVHLLPSEGTPKALGAPAGELADRLLTAVQATRASAA
jgi:hypothetical protein